MGPGLFHWILPKFNNSFSLALKELLNLTFTALEVHCLDLTAPEEAPENEIMLIHLTHQLLGFFLWHLEKLSTIF